MLKFQGKNGISAAVVQSSISDQGVILHTLELEYPRFILAEVNTHRMLSKNSASSRAIPVAKMHSLLSAEPVFWGANKPGMSASEEIGEIDRAKHLWESAKESAVKYSTEMSASGLHKQITNRVTEPWMMVKTVISGTEWANFLWLRNHPDAQPEIHELAKCIEQVLSGSGPQHIGDGEWHVPYIDRIRGDDGVLRYFSSGQEVTVETAKKVSASCCAQVSYRALDVSIEKAEMIFDKLINSEPMHASPVEHQATPIHFTDYSNPHDYWSEGITHQDKYGTLWSGNFRDWIQYRKMLPNESK
jgi:thymidylate synthase ThyX